MPDGVQPDLAALCLQVNRLAGEVAAYIREQGQRFDRGAFSGTDIEAKGIGDFVTIVDRTSEQRLIDGLQRIFPAASILAEEATVAPEDKPYTWIIDPLDGTTNFIHGIPLYAISIALAHHGHPVLGVIYEVNQDECFYAWEGAPAYLNDRIITPSDTTAVSESLLVTGFPYDHNGRLDEYLQLFRHFVLNSRGIRRLGSAATDMAYVACGRFEGFYEYGLQPWDVAAGTVIVRQAGGMVTDFEGGDDFIANRTIVVTNGHIHQEMQEAVRDHF